MEILTLGGDGIGSEVMQVASDVLEHLKSQGLPLEITGGLIGGAAYEQYGDPLPPETMELAQNADAVLLGAVGDHARYGHLPKPQRPESALLGLRKTLGLYANLRPIQPYPELANISSIKEERAAGTDILIVRELTGGLYFSNPRGIRTDEHGERVGTNTMEYSESEIRRIAEVGFDLAGDRQGKLCSVDKANVLEVSELWRSVVNEVALDNPDIELTHMYTDNAAWQVNRDPTQFDIILTDNSYGDTLSDQLAELAGSLGMLPSASLAPGSPGLYEPIHGSAPDIAGTDSANPLGMVLSVALMFEHSLKQTAVAGSIRAAVAKVLEQGLRTADIYQADTPGIRQVGTLAMGAAVMANL